MAGTALVLGASRSLGLAATAELAERGWDVVATVRGAPSAELVATGARIEQGVDLTDPGSLAALRDRLDGLALDLLYVNAGVTGDDVPVGEVSTEEFARVMVTNALGPMRVLETLGPLVPPTGTVAVVTSRQGSIGLNERGGHEVYRASKSALNQLVRSWAARDPADPRTLLLLHPGWVRTELGGSDAPLEVPESARGLVDVVEAQAGHGGLQFLDHRGDPVAW